MPKVTKWNQKCAKMNQRATKIRSKSISEKGHETLAKRTGRRRKTGNHFESKKHKSKRKKKHIQTSIAEKKIEHIGKIIPNRTKIDTKNRPKVNAKTCIEKIMKVI